MKNKKYISKQINKEKNQNVRIALKNSVFVSSIVRVSRRMQRLVSIDVVVGLNFEDVLVI